MAAPGKLFPDPDVFQCQRNAPFLQDRMNVWNELKTRSDAECLEARLGADIQIQLSESPDQPSKPGIAFETRPLDFMPKLPIEELRRNPFVAARVFALSGQQSNLPESEVIDADDDECDLANENDADISHLERLLGEKDIADERDASRYTLWDLGRPLEGSCRLEFVRFEESEGQHVFWHSSAHILGQALEMEFGGYLTIGPALKDGFFYDVFLGSRKLNEQDCKQLESRIRRLISDGLSTNMEFERLVVSKDDALRLFAYNPFKVQLIQSKVPDGALTCCYRCGSLIDLCRGPHIPNMSVFSSGVAEKHAFKLPKHSCAHWQAKDGNDSLQRVYGISFPNPEQLVEWEEQQEAIKQRKHQHIGQAQELFFFNEKFSPGCAFWSPHGARLYNKLCEWMRSEQRLRGFVEVITPNMFRSEIFKTSAHYWTYPERYSLNDDGEEWMLKPMNCPAHCTIFGHRTRSYKELPIRMADFGVLHRKEPSGSLSGLSRVRRFQQDDGHIFCRPDQVEEELCGALDFMKYVYDELKLKYSFLLSTRPKKAIGSRELWNKAECQLAKALNHAGVSWKLEKGEGAFYGPKIDIMIEGVSGKAIQCATIQLDFQLPMRFNLQYDDRRSSDLGNASASVLDMEEASRQEKRTPEEREMHFRGHGVERSLKPGFQRPVIIHRAVLGSLERFSSVLAEHCAGKWPFFLNPRQVMVIPVNAKFNEYSDYVALQMRKVGGLNADSNTDKGGNLDKKISVGIAARYSFLAVVGGRDQQNLTVTLRPRDEMEAALLPKQDAQDPKQRVLPLADCVDILKGLNMPCSQDIERFDSWHDVDPRSAALEWQPKSAE